MFTVWKSCWGSGAAARCRRRRCRWWRRLARLLLLPLHFCFFCVFPSLPFLSCCLCYYWKMKTQTKTMVVGDGGLNREDRGSSSCVFLCTPSIGSFFFCSFCPSFFFPHVLAPPWLFLFILPRFCDFPSHRFSFSGIYNQRMPCGRMDFNAGHPFLSFFLFSGEEDEQCWWPFAFWSLMFWKFCN